MRLDRTDRNDNFFFSLSRPSPIYFGLKRSHNVYFEFFEFCYYFFGIFYYASCRNETERNEFCCYLLPLRILLLFFLNFQLWVGWVGTDRNNNFHYLSFLAFSNVFWIEKKPQWSFLIFWICLLFFWNFLLRVWLERNITITFVFSISQPFPTYFGLKWTHMGIYYFDEFCCYFFGIFNCGSGG